MACANCLCNFIDLRGETFDEVGIGKSCNIDIAFFERDYTTSQFDIVGHSFDFGKPIVKINQRFEYLLLFWMVSLFPHGKSSRKIISIGQNLNKNAIFL